MHCRCVRWGMIPEPCRRPASSRQQPQVGYGQDAAADAARELEAGWQAAQPVLRHLGGPCCTTNPASWKKLASTDLLLRRL